MIHYDSVNENVTIVTPDLKSFYVIEFHLALGLSPSASSPRIILHTIVSGIKPKTPNEQSTSRQSPRGCRGSGRRSGPRV